MVIFFASFCRFVLITFCAVLSAVLPCIKTELNENYPALAGGLRGVCAKKRYAKRQERMRSRSGCICADTGSDT